MFQQILVPLDGSKRAESALPTAARLARASNGTVILVRVVPPPPAPGKFSGLEPYSPHVSLDEALAEASSYLQVLARSETLSDVKTQWETPVGHDAPAILSAIQSLHADIVILSSHGFTGFKRWMFGSVAQKLVHHSTVPVLVLRDGGPTITETAQQPLQVTVPLDGSHLSEAALEPAAQLVTALAPLGQRTLRLLRVVDLPDSYGKFRSMADSYYDSTVRAEMKEEDVKYLNTVAKRFTEGDLANYHLAITTTVATDPDVAEAVIQVAGQTEGAAFPDNHVIVMSTHGRGGLQRWALGSITDRVLHTSKLPILVVHVAHVPHEAHKEPEGAESATV